jgi:hypothetical protein
MYLNHKNKNITFSNSFAGSYTKNHFPSIKAGEKAFEGVSFEDADYMQKKGLI